MSVDITQLMKKCVYYRLEREETLGVIYSTLPGKWVNVSDWWHSVNSS